MDKSLLVIGGDSLVGRAIAGAARRGGGRVFCTTRREAAVDDETLFLDLGAEFGEWRPPPVDVAVLCAAMTRIDACRRDPETARRVNVEGPVAAARRLVGSGTFVIFLSTNQVFDGTIPFVPADEPVSPRTEYGRQKAEAERQLLDLGEDRVAVVRCTKIVDSVLALIRDWKQAFDAGRPVQPFADLRFSPVPMAAVVDVVRAIGDVRHGGIWQISGDDDVTYAEAAAQAASAWNVDPSLVQPIVSHEAGRAIEHLPDHTTLDVARVRRELTIDMPPVERTLAAAFARCQPGIDQNLSLSYSSSPC